ncbi:MAG: hypothetical protein L0H59_18355 [Tomitella sp.]|nr:hypothetical protein [Tomitella sp.]
MHLVANVAGQTHMDDPVRAITDIAQALGTSTIMGGAEYAADTVKFDGKQFSMSPSSETMLGRMAHYSNPINQEEGFESAMGSLSKIAGMGIGAGITVLKNVLAPDAIASYAAVGLVNPAAAIPLVLGRVGGAVMQMVPPSTVEQGVNVAFNEVTNTVKDNTEVAELAMDTQLWDTITKHGSYGSSAVGANGETATEIVTAWTVAAAEDSGGEVGATPTQGESTGPGDELLSSVNRLSATQILNS